MMLQDRFKGCHSDVYIRALRSVPADVAVSLPDEQLDALVLGICKCINDVGDIVHRHYEKKAEHAAQ